MMRPENTRGWEYASPEQVSTLCENLQSWLENEGQYLVEPTDTIYGAQDGLPIADDGSAFVFTATASAVECFAPEATRRLEVDGEVTFVYRPPFYAYNPDVGHEYRPPRLELHIEKPPYHELESELIVLTGGVSEEKFWRGIRVADERQTVTPEEVMQLAGSEELRVARSNESLARAMGVYDLTRTDAESIEQIIARLSDIKQFQELRSA